MKMLKGAVVINKNGANFSKDKKFRRDILFYCGWQAIQYMAQEFTVMVEILPGTIAKLHSSPWILTEQ